ncbi:MAG: 2-oxo acid dehydrogenase subunit E2 [Hyphomicrobiaceae bacterium]|nr:MAG: 2-oxo acid dehydrogenase subunit E2 [Hyphomicrobiaceae bacterium]
MKKTFRLPDLGEGLQEAEIVSWHVSVGDRIVVDQPLVSVETAKAVVEVPAPWSGSIVKVYGALGQIVKIGEPLVDIETEAGERADAGAVVGELPQAPPAEAKVRAAAPPAAGRAVPAVRARAKALGVDLAGIAGTGPGGSISMADVEAAAHKALAGSGYEPLRGVRRAMAENMTRAASIIPATVTDEADIDHWPPNPDVTIRLVRAVAAGCAAAPELNAWFDGERAARRLHDNIDLGLALNTEDGLFVPVLRNVARRSDEDIRRGIEAMKRDIAARSVPPHELRGQTITLSNFGMFGWGLTAALGIVAPQVAILGAGRIHKAPRVVSDQVQVRKVLPLSLTFDHRVVSGAEAVRFLGAAITSLQT